MAAIAATAGATGAGRAIVVEREQDSARTGLPGCPTNPVRATLAARAAVATGLAGVDPISARRTVTAVATATGTTIAGVTAAAQDPGTVATVTADTAASTGTAIGARLTGQHPVDAIGATATTAVTAVAAVADQ
jgi:hypothetical protein